MADVRVVTNGVPRDVVDAAELSAEERAEFDYLDWPAIERGEESASFFRYRGTVYDLGEFQGTRGTAGEELRRWDGFLSDSFFSAVVVRYVDAGERVVVGLLLS